MTRPPPGLTRLRRPAGVSPHRVVELTGVDPATVTAAEQRLSEGCAREADADAELQRARG
ncbi:hypothetical protein [Streptomyces canus]|uniref:hypothetical protein n=1 Tax=Streptomyces canus TaxID=58343 RepID=UPI0007470BC2|nr:hypothetical protein [Streptomyces canus]KUN12418.1 hypothetical protein AQI96_14530 [Streptomyces canus]